MAVTTIKWVVNKSNVWVYYQNHERPEDWVVMPPNRVLRTDYPWSVNTGIPWCTSQSDFNGQHFLEIGGWNSADRSVPGFYVWQHDRWGKDGDRVRFATSGWVDVSNNWVPGGDTVGGERGCEIYNPIPSSPGPGHPFMQLRPVSPKPPSFEAITSVELRGGRDNVAPQPEELVPGAPPGAPYKKLPIPSTFNMPTTGQGVAVIAWFPGPSLPNNQDLWRLTVFPDGPQPYPGLSTDRIRIAFRTATSSEKYFRIWTPSAGSYQMRDWDGVVTYRDRINWYTLSRGEIMTFEKARDLGGEPLMYVDPNEFFRVFGGKCMIIDWAKDR